MTIVASLPLFSGDARKRASKIDEQITLSIFGRLGGMEGEDWVFGRWVRMA